MTQFKSKFFAYSVLTQKEEALALVKVTELPFLPSSKAAISQPHFSQSLGKGTTFVTYTPLSCCSPTGQSLLSP